MIMFRNKKTHELITLDENEDNNNIKTYRENKEYWEELHII